MPGWGYKSEAIAFCDEGCKEMEVIYTFKEKVKENVGEKRQITSIE